MMAQFALLIILVSIVLMLLSGAPRRREPAAVAPVPDLLPAARHFVSFSQVIIYRGGGLSAVWPQFANGDGRRARVLRLQPGAVPQVDCRDEMMR